MDFNEPEKKLMSFEEKQGLRLALEKHATLKPYRPRPTYLLHNFAKSALSVALLLVFPGISVWYIAEQSFPRNSFFYEIKRGAEEVAVLFYNTPEAQIAYREQQIERRVKEATKLVATGQMTIGRAEVINRDIASHVAMIEEVAKKDDSSDLTRTLEILDTQVKVLTAVKSSTSFDQEEGLAIAKLASVTTALKSDVGNNIKSNNPEGSAPNTGLVKSNQKTTKQAFNDNLDTVRRLLIATQLDLAKVYQEFDWQSVSMAESTIKTEKYIDLKADESVAEFSKISLETNQATDHLSTNKPEAGLEKVLGGNDFESYAGTVEVSGALSVWLSLRDRFFEFAKISDISKESLSLLIDLKTDLEALSNLLDYSNTNLADGLIKETIDIGQQKDPVFSEADLLVDKEPISDL